MSYVDENLMSGESVVYRGKLHITFLARSALATAFWAVCTLAVVSDKQLEPGVKGLMILTLLVPLGVFVDRFVTYMTSEFVITDKRIVIKTGFIRRNTLETFIEKVESLNIDQGILGRILGYGKLGIRGAGGSLSTFHGLAKPMVFRREFYNQIEASKGKQALRMAS